jgi:ribosomal protein S18 acetylase RimI-like enzyme
MDATHAEPMLELAQGLSDSHLEAIAELEHRAVRHDGGRLKLEWSSLRRRPAVEINDLLWWEEGVLVGFLGVYVYGGAAPELAGMVDPQCRRRGIGAVLLQRALALTRERTSTQPLLVVPRSSEGGRVLALKFGGKLQHSEHALELVECQPAISPRADSPCPVALRDATEADRKMLSALMLDGFGSSELDDERPLHNDHTRTLMIMLGNEAVGTLRVSLGGTRAGVYGFVIASEQRGHGFGGQAVRIACGNLFQAGATAVGLEVAVDNERALKLYTDLGFRPVTTEDYYEMQ